MKVNNTLAETQKKPKFTVAIQTEGYKNLINRTLGERLRASPSRPAERIVPASQF